MYVDSSAFGRVKGGETGMYHVPLAVNVYMEEVKMVMGRRGVRFLEDGRE